MEQITIPATGRAHTRTAFARNVVVGACAASAGAHTGLVPAHLDEAPGLGAAFIVAVVSLLAVVAALVLRPGDRRPVHAAALLLGGLIVAYAAASTTGIPLLAPHAEPVDGVGLATKGVEALGLLAALTLKPARATRRSPATRR